MATITFQPLSALGLPGASFALQYDDMQMETVLLQLQLQRLQGNRFDDKNVQLLEQLFALTDDAFYASHRELAGALARRWMLELFQTDYRIAYYLGFNLLQNSQPLEMVADDMAIQHGDVVLRLRKGSLLDSRVGLDLIAFAHACGDENAVALVEELPMDQQAYITEKENSLLTPKCKTIADLLAEQRMTPMTALTAETAQQLIDALARFI